MASTKKAARRAALASAVVAVLSAEAHFNSYDMQLVRVIDSDTYRAVVQLWPGITQKVDVRVNGIDTPEKFRPSKKCKAHEKALAEEATALAQAALDAAARVYVTGVGLGKYAGRVVGDVVLVDAVGGEQAIADMLLTSGLAVEYHGGKKVKDWCGVNP